MAIRKLLSVVLAAAIAVPVATLLPVSNAVAQSTKDRLLNLENRLGQVERKVNNNDAQTDMLRKIQQLEAENQALRNELETLQFQTTQSADRQRQLYLDLDQRLQAIQSGPAAANNPNSPLMVVGGSAQIAQAGGGGSDRQAYQAAFDLLKEGRYDEAAAGFKQFLSTYTNSELRDNAQYWLAETHYVSQKFETALDGFQAVVTGYPTSRKIADAWLKIGYCNYELKRWSDARQALSIVTTRFPESTAARLAGQRLQMMNAEGR